MITLGTDKVILGEGDDCCFLFPCFTYDKVGADTVTLKDGRGVRYRLTPECTRLADQAAIVAFLESANDLLCGGDNDIDPEFEYVGITTTVYCRLSDNKKVVVRTCKLEDGSIEITDTDSGAALTDATLASGYDAECPILKVVDLKETNVIIPLGGTEQTVTPPAIGYDALSIFNCSPCPQLATVTLTVDGTSTTHKVVIEPAQTRVFDWQCDAITDFTIGEVEPITATISSDDLSTQPATADLKTRVTFFNS